MLDKEGIFKILKHHCIANDVVKLPRGHIRVGTRLSYLDGSGIDVFFDGNQEFDELWTLTDFGQTLSNLSEYQIKPKDRIEMIRDAVSPLSVHIVKDQLSIGFSDEKSLSQAVYDLAQACIRVSCLAFTKRETQKRFFREQVRQVLDDTGIKFEERYEYSGPFKNQVRVDYRTARGFGIAGRKREVAILTLGSGHAQAIEVFRKWSDLKKASVTDRFVTIFDESDGKRPPEDLKRLEDVSEVVSIRHRQSIKQLLAA